MAAAYQTLDYLPDLTLAEIGAARPLTFKPYGGPGPWTTEAAVSGLDSNALLHDLYKFSATEGASYDIYSVSFFDPFLLRVYDAAGNTIIANSEADDPADFKLSDGYYSVDSVSFKAPYTGDYYVAANWNQGQYYKFYSLQVASRDSAAAEPPVTIPQVAANIFMGEGANLAGSPFSNVNFYGGNGVESVGLAAGAAGVVIDQNVERLSLAGTADAYLYKQQGNQLLVFDGQTQVVKITVQGDADGTAMQFANGAAAVKLSGVTMMIGGGAVSGTSPTAVSIALEGPNAALASDLSATQHFG